MKPLLIQPEISEFCFVYHMDPSTM